MKNTLLAFLLLVTGSRAFSQIHAHFYWKNPCTGSAVQFYDSSYTAPTSWNWNFGDPGSGTNTSTSQNPSHSFTKSGTFNVTLIANKPGYSDTIIRVVTVYNGPATKSSNDTTICKGQTIIIHSSGGVSYKWTASKYLSDSTNDTASVFPLQSTSFYVKVYNSSGCFTRDTVKITIDSTSAACKPKSISGIVNKYLKVISIDSCSNEFTVDSGSYLKAGDKVLIIQMKGADINIKNNASFGSVTNYNSAGLYEKAVISAISGNKLYFKNRFLNNYDSKAFVQVITIPQYVNITISSPLTARGWDVSTGKGGIIILEATGSITLSSDIDMSGKGFAGGSVSDDMTIYSCASVYPNYHYAWNASPYWGGEKGESFAILDDSLNGGKGHNASGGGGGNNINAGGAGGGNYGLGGAGGKTYYCGGGTGGGKTQGGIGGVTFNYSANPNRIFPGGGGGGGQQNNSVGTSGTNGGGIIMLSANTLLGSGKLLSNGISQSNTSGNDRAGGGGAGGTILLDIPHNFSSVKVEVHGGDGGSVNNTICHGPGGGGGGGLLWTKMPNFFPTTSVDTSGGAPGTSLNSTAPCYKTSYGAGTGNAGGILSGLPASPQSIKPFIKFAFKSSPDTTICLGDSAHLRASGGVSYLWNNTAIISDSVSASAWGYPVVNTQFIVTATDSHSCIAIDTVHVTVDSTSAKCKHTSISGIINKYAQVTGIDTCLYSITVDTATGFSVGNKVLIIQMKGATIDSSNTSSYGKILNINEAGNYEYVTIDSISGKTFFLKYKFVNNYTPSGIVQIVSVPQYGNVKISDTLRAKPWNGNKGGIVIFESSGSVVLNADVKVDGLGFAGGSVSLNGYNCNSTDYYYDLSSDKGGKKGEGIVLYNSNYAKGRGAYANGGGGGDDHNSGGAGGSNYGIGGAGSKEWSSCGSPKANGGVGGYSLAKYYTSNKIFLGGGGGEGHANQGDGTGGANGAGIVIIKAKAIFGNNKTIRANGASQLKVATDDRAGGGGGAGTILLNAPRIVSKLNVLAKGGKGGDDNYSGCVGLGGGGGGGIVMLPSGAFPKINATLSGGNHGQNIASGSSCGAYGSDSGRVGAIVGGLNTIQGNTPVNRVILHLSGKGVVACPGDSTLLSSNITNAAKYTWSPGNRLSDSTKEPTWAKPVKTTLFTLHETDARGCMQSDTHTISLNPRIVPRPPVLHCVSVINDTTIQLSWKISPDSTNTSWYIIYKGYDSTTLVKVDSVKGGKAISYSDRKIKNTDSIPVYYALRAANGCGFAGGRSNVLRSMIVKYKILSDKKIRITWNDPDTLKKFYYTIQADTGKGFQKLDTSSRKTYVYRGCGFNGKMRVFVQDSITSCKSYSGLTNKIINADKTPASPDVIYTASVLNTKAISITFTKADSQDVKTYTILRSSGGASFKPIVMIARFAPATYTYIDNSVKADSIAYCYKVVSTDSCGNQSDSAKVHCPVFLQGTAGDYRSFLNWSVYSGFATDSQYVEKNIGGKWIVIAHLGSGINSYTDSTNTYCKVKYYYRILTTEQGGNKQQSLSDSVEVTPFDTIRPAAPSINYVTVKGNNAIEIQWTKSASADVNRYVISREDSTGKWHNIDTIGNTNIYSDSVNGLVSRSVCYRVCAIDSCASNISPFSSAHCSIYLHTAIKGCEKSISLNWNVYGGWTASRNEIYRSKSGGAFALLKSLGGSATTYKDSGLDFHATYCYRIKAYQSGGLGDTSFSNISCNQTFVLDTPQLLYVSKLNSSKTTGQVIIKWQVPSSTKKLNYYTLYYSKTASGPYAVLKNKIPITQDSFVHSGINTKTGENYYYLVLYDSCGTRSDSSGIHKTMDLSITIGQLVHHLIWTPYQGFKVKNYYVQTYEKGIYSNFDTLPGTDTAYKRFPAPCNFTITYRIAAGGYTGLISYSDTSSKKAIDTVPSNPSTMVNLTVLNGNSTKLNFIGADSLDDYIFGIQRSKNGIWGTAGSIKFIKPKDSLQFIDKVSTLIPRLGYTVLTMDSCLNTTTTDTFYAIQLQGHALNLGDSLNWYPFIGYAIDSYTVQHWDGTTWTTLAKLPGTDTAYKHSPLQCNVRQTYRILGTEKGGLGRTTLSDSITLTPFDKIPPPAPVTDYASVLDGTSIYFQWEKAVPKVKQYALYLKSANGSWNYITTLNQRTSYIFKGLDTPDSTYSMYVEAVDSCMSNHSAPGTVHTPVQLDGSALNLAIGLKWSAYQGMSIAKYYIFRRDKGWVKKDSVSGTTLSWVDGGLQCNMAHTYRIGALDTSGKFLSYSDTFSTTPIDTTKPTRVVVNYATVLPNHTIKFSWKWNTPNDAKYFEIWRSKNGATFGKVGSVTYDSTYIDAAVSPQTDNYAYYIISVDSCSLTNRSQPSDTARIMNIKLATGACSPEVSLNWTAYSKFPVKLSGYEIYRQAKGGSFIKIKSLSSTILSFKDTTVRKDTIYSYKILARDATAGFTSFSDTLTIQPVVWPGPDSVKTLAASVIKTSALSGEIRLDWSKYVGKDTFVRGYHIYHSLSSKGPFSLLYDEKNLGVTSFLHAGINTTGTRHFYYVKAYNLCNVEGDSNIMHSPVVLYVKNKNLEADLNWSAYEGFDSIKTYSLLRAYDGGAYHTIATIYSPDTAWTDTNIRCGHSYAYRILTQQYGGAVKNSYSDSVIITAFDTIPPAKPAMIVASVTASGSSTGSISLQFRGHAEKNRNGFEIYRSADGINYSLLKVINDTFESDISFSDQKLNTMGTAYSYYIKAIDSCLSYSGKTSIPSDTHRVALMTATAMDGYDSISWTPYRGWGNYTYLLERKTPNTGWVTSGTFTKGMLNFNDIHTRCDTFYTYRITTLDTNGLSSYSNIMTVKAFENNPPAPPVISTVSVLKTGLGDGSIFIKWQASVTPIVASYNLFRSQDSGSTWIEIIKDIVADSFIDNSLYTYSTSYSYRLQSHDSCHNLSIVFSAPHKSILLKAVSGEEKIHIHWSAYKGWQPQQYKVFRNDTLIATLGGNEISYTDSLVICPLKYTYYVEADSGKLRALSNRDSSSPMDHTPSPPSYLKTATVSEPNDKIYIEWTPSNKRDAAKYFVYRRKNNEYGFSLVHTTTSAKDTFYTDSFNINASYCYQVNTIDHCGNLSQPSNEGCIMYLEGNADKLVNGLSWNPYKQWRYGVDKYNIYRQTDSGGYVLLNTKDSIERIYEDTALSIDSKNYCYRIEAIERGGRQGASMSTQLCLQQEPVVWIPNAFTPFSTPGLNDKFGPKGIFISHFDMEIFDRWGERIFQTAESKYWDGTVMGKVAPEGVYIYLIKTYSYILDKPVFFKGNVMILR